MSGVALKSLQVLSGTLAMRPHRPLQTGAVTSMLTKELPSATSLASVGLNLWPTRSWTGTVPLSTCGHVAHMEDNIPAKEFEWQLQSPPRSTTYLCPSSCAALPTSRSHIHLPRQSLITGSNDCRWWSHLQVKLIFGGISNFPKTTQR